MKENENIPVQPTLQEINIQQVVQQQTNYLNDQLSNFLGI